MDALERYEEKPLWLSDHDWMLFENTQNALKGVKQPEESTEYDMQALSHPQSKFPPEVKVACVAAYLATGGNYRRAAKLVGIRKQIMVNWKNTAPWWEDVTERVRILKNEQLDDILTSSLDKATEEISHRLAHGEDIVRINKRTNRETGEEIYEEVRFSAPISTKDLVSVTDLAFRIRQVMRGDPSNISGQKVSKTGIQELATMLAEANEQVREKTVVSEQ